MKNLIFIAALFFVGESLVAQKIQAYQWFNEKGKKVSFEKMARKVADQEVILFGEYHDDAIAHWMQLELSKYLYDRDTNLVLGAEMFERDVQHLLNAYMKDSISADQFEDTVPSMWNNYPTDYAPLVDFARDKNLPFIGTNIPRYIASAVYRGGFEVLDTLSTEVQGYLPPLPFPYDPDLPGYKAMLDMGHGHSSPTMPMAQAVKDATMAWQIVQHLPKDGTFLHFNGNYHSDNFEGIYWYLQQFNPGVECSTITTVRQEDLRKLNEEHKGVADFILVVDKDMTRTY